MIYAVISRVDILTEYYSTHELNNNFFTDDIRKDIFETGNKKIREERIAAYTSLFYSLDKLFSVKPEKVLKTKYGKPYIQEGIYFSISHSNGLSVVTLSDKTEVGVDIQELISENIGRKVNDRFLSGLEFSESDFDPTMLYLSVTDDGRLTLEPLLSDCSSIVDEEGSVLVDSCEIPKINIPLDLPIHFSEKSVYYTKMWTGAEAVAKLYGKGLGDLIKNKEIVKKAYCNYKTIIFNDKYYLMANAVFKSDIL